MQHNADSKADHSRPGAEQPAGLDLPTTCWTSVRPWDAAHAADADDDVDEPPTKSTPAVPPPEPASESGMLCSSFICSSEPAHAGQLYMCEKAKGQRDRQCSPCTAAGMNV